jgi:hypothetical protein
LCKEKSGNPASESERLQPSMKWACCLGWNLGSLGLGRARKLWARVGQENFGLGRARKLWARAGLGVYTSGSGFSGPGSLFSKSPSTTQVYTSGTDNVRTYVRTYVCTYVCMHICTYVKECRMIFYDMASFRNSKHLFKEICLGSRRSAVRIPPGYTQERFPGEHPMPLWKLA